MRVTRPPPVACGQLARGRCNCGSSRRCARAPGSPHAPCTVSPRLPRRRKVPRADRHRKRPTALSRRALRWVYDGVRAACIPLPSRRTRPAPLGERNPAGRTWAPHARPARSCAAVTACTISPVCAHQRAPRVAASTCRCTRRHNCNSALRRNGLCAERDSGGYGRDHPCFLTGARRPRDVCWSSSRANAGAAQPGYRPRRAACGARGERC